MPTPSLNGPCPCGSGKKYKRCCGSRAGRGTAAPAQSLPRLAGAALARLQQGDAAGAAPLLDQALALAPADASLLGLKGMALHGLGHDDEAARHIERAIALRPDDSRLHNFLGQVLAGRAHALYKIRAERAFAQAVSLDPAFVEAWWNLGQAQLGLSKPLEAAHSFGQALRHAPADGELHLQLARARYLCGDWQAAGEAAVAAAAHGVDPVRAGLWQALVLRAQGRADEAQAIEERCLADAGRMDGLYVLLHELGRGAMLAGHLADAERWFRHCITLWPDSAAAYQHLAATRRFGEADRELVARMEDLLAQDRGSHRRGLEFALGKVLTDLGEHDRAFAHYRAGNDLVRRTVPYDRAAAEAEVDRIIEWATPERLAGLAPGSDSDLPILIVGTPRSGTSLTEQVISSHTLAAGAGEMEFWPRLGPAGMETYSPAVARQLADGYLALLRQHAPAARRVTDKMPGNYMFLGLIHAVFPRARIVHCRRHPIDACLSIYFQDFDDSEAYKWDLDSLAHFYGLYQRLMAHWRAVLPAGVMYELHYEALVDDFEGESRKLMAFLGLDWEPGLLDFHRQDRAVFTPSNWQVRQPIYKTSKERWRRYEKHLGPLLDLLKYVDGHQGPESWPVP